MQCPYCRQVTTEVVNSRATKGAAQIWRRRRCLSCGEIFTTHEIVDLSHLVVIKKSGASEMFSHIKLYSGIYGATLGSKIAHRESLAAKITEAVEHEILFLKQKKVNSSAIADIVLLKLRKMHTATFLRFLTYCKDISNETQMKIELKKYT